MGNIVSVLTAWCDNCDSMLTNIEAQVDKVNKEKSDNNSHKASLEQKIKYVLIVWMYLKSNCVH